MSARIDFKDRMNKETEASFCTLCSKVCDPWGPCECDTYQLKREVEGLRKAKLAAEARADSLQTAVKLAEFDAKENYEIACEVSAKHIAERDAALAKLAAAEAETVDAKNRADTFERNCNRWIAERDAAVAKLAEAEARVGMADRATLGVWARLTAAEAAHEEYRKWARSVAVGAAEERDAAVAQVESNGLWARIATDRLHQIDDAMAQVARLREALAQIVTINDEGGTPFLKVWQRARAVLEETK